MIMNLPAAYQVLDLPIGSSLEVVQVRYRQLAKKYHPDKCVDAKEKALAEERLKLINEAKEVIQKHWFDAKIKASEPIPHGQSPGAKPDRPAASQAAKAEAKTKPKAEPERSAAEHKAHPKAKAKTPPPPPPEPSPPKEWWQEILQSLNAELLDVFKKMEKRAPWDDALEQLDKPIKLSSETKLRRAWYAIAIIIVVDIAYTGYCENMERRKTGSTEPQAQHDLRGLTPVAQALPTAPRTIDERSQQAEQERKRTAIYFKRLELDAAERAIAKDSELIDEIEIKLQTDDMANESRRVLEHMKVLREQDKKQKEVERVSILEELSQLG